MDLKDLAKPFEEKYIDWRAGSTTNDKTRALAMAYIDARAVMNRLDEVVGPSNWCDDYKPAPDGGVLCGISIRIIDDVWVTKWDGAENSDFEAVKGGLSDAFKRAAVKWGIGRYLYDIPAQWVDCEVFGKTVKLKGKPVLPEWAKPNGKPTQTETKTDRTTQPAQEAAPTMTLEEAEAIESITHHKPYGLIESEALTYALNQMMKTKSPSDEQLRKMTAIRMILADRNAK